VDLLAHQIDCDEVQPIAVKTSIFAAVALALARAEQLTRSHLDPDQPEQSHPRGARPCHTDAQCRQCMDKELRELG